MLRLVRSSNDMLWALDFKDEEDRTFEPQGWPEQVLERAIRYRRKC